jgi:hypothetical protein
LETGRSPAGVNYFLLDWKWVNRKSDEGFGYAATPAADDLQALARTVWADYSLVGMDGGT